MIEKIKHIELLDRLNLPKDQYLLTGGAWLSLMNIRENQDIDIIVTETLRNNFDSYVNKLELGMRIQVKDKIDISKKHANKISAIAKVKNHTRLVEKHYVEIEGYKFIFFDLFYKYKRPRKGDKHRNDNKRIHRFFKCNKHMLPEYRNIFDSCRIAPISDIILYYRDDIVFRMYVLRENKQTEWKEFCKIKANEKVDYHKLYGFYDSIKKEGQRVPVRVVRMNDKLYPVSGATRLGCMMEMGFHYVKIEEISLPNHMWNDAFTLRTHHFRDLSQNTIDSFIKFSTDIGQSLSETADYYEV